MTCCCILCGCHDQHVRMNMKRGAVEEGPPGSEGCIFGGQLQSFLQSGAHVCQPAHILPPFDASTTPLHPIKWFTRHT